MAKFADYMEKIGEGVTEGYQKIESGVVGSYKKIEAGVVDGYKKIETGVVSGFTVMTDRISDTMLHEDGSLKTSKVGEAVLEAYKKIENAFVNTFIARAGESVEEAKARICAAQKVRDVKMKAEAEKHAVAQQTVIDTVEQNGEL